VVVLTETKSELKEFDFYTHDAYNFQHETRKAWTEYEATEGAGQEAREDGVPFETKATGGVCVMINKELKHACTILPYRPLQRTTKLGSTVSLRINQKLLNPENEDKQITIIGQYVPHRASKYYDEGTTWQDTTQVHVELANKYQEDILISLGDYNARTGINQSPIPDDLTEGGDADSGFTRVLRDSEDAIMNEHGHKLDELEATCALINLHGLRKVGDYTVNPQDFDKTVTFEPRGSERKSAIDTINVSKDSIRCVKNFLVLDNFGLSDHYPV
jgi:exonuclease III